MHAQDRQRYQSYAGTLPQDHTNSGILPVQDYTRSYAPRQREDFIDEPTASGFFPIREPVDSGNKSPLFGPKPENERGDIPPTGFMPAQDFGRSTQYRQMTRGSDPILPSIEDLSSDIGFSGNRGDPRNTPSPSPLTDMKEIRRALPDP